MPMWRFDVDEIEFDEITAFGTYSFWVDFLHYRIWS